VNVVKRLITRFADVGVVLTGPLMFCALSSSAVYGWYASTAPSTSPWAWSANDRPSTTTPASLPAQDDVAAPTITTAPPAPPTTLAPVPSPATTTVAAPPLAPTPTPAPTPTTPRPLTVEERGQQALVLIRYPWPATGYSIVFSGPREGFLGLTVTETRTVNIYVRNGQSAGSIARVIAHELGHAVDITMTTDEERLDYLGIRGLGDVPWYPDCLRCSDYGSPAGDFAEVFTYWLLGDGSFNSLIGGTPSAIELAQLQPIFTP
jgi:hypothetical protein